MPKRDYLDEIRAALTKARKARNAEAVVYYGDKATHVACVSFESFQGSWAYEEWRKKHATEIATQEAQFKRF